MERPAYMVPAVSSLGLHLMFGVLIGGFWLSQEVPPEPKPVEFKIIEKKPPPEKEEIKKKLLEPKPIEVPVVEPVQLNEPIQRQQVVQQVPQFQKQEVVPLKMDQIPTVSNAPQVAMRQPRSNIAPSRTIQAVQPSQVVTTSKATGAVSIRKPRVQAMTVPTLAPQPMAKVTQSTGSRRVMVRKGTLSAITNKPSAPVAMAPVTQTTAKKPTSNVAAPKAAPVRTAPVQAVVAQPVAEEPKAPPAPPAPSAAQASTDPGVLNGYSRRVRMRLEKVGQRAYKRSPLRRASQQGRVVLGFTVIRSGDIKDVRVITRSPFERLDQLAVDSLNKAAPFAEFSDDIIEDELIMKLPISFKLR